MAGNILGIDIGSKNIRLALVQQGKKSNILKTVTIDTPDDCVSDGDINDILKVALTIKRTIEDEELKCKELSLSINSSQIGVREFSLPSLKESEIYHALEFDLSKTFKGIGDTHNISYKIHTKTKAGICGIVCFCPKKIIEKYEELGMEIGVPLKYIDVNPNCTVKAYNTFVIKQDTNNSIMIVDIGFNNSQVSIIDQNKLIISRNVPMGGYNLDKLVSEKLNISIEEAENDKLRKFYGYLAKGYDIDAFIKEGYDGVFQEVGQTINFYCSKHNRKISNLFLMGGGSLITNIESIFTDVFKISSTTIKPTDNNSVFIKEFNQYLPSIGAALRED